MQQSMFQHRLWLQHRHRLQHRIAFGLLIVALLAVPLGADAQTQDGATQSNAPYRLSVSVNEVSLTFHAAGAHGLPIRDLRQDELHILDNGAPPRRIVSFQSMENFPIRAGILRIPASPWRDIVPAIELFRSNMLDACYGSKPTRHLS